MSDNHPEIHAEEINTHLERIEREFAEGFEFVRNYPRSVTVFGSSMTKPAEDIYKKCSELTGRIAGDLKYAVLTGGGPGIMEAANKGAYDAGGVSLGLNVSIPHERMTNAYVTHAIKFTYFFSRKAMLMFASEAYIFFPGGFGTFDELFGVMTLVQTGKIPRVPIVLFGSEFWNPLKSFVVDEMLKKHHAIDERDLQLFEITDSIDRAVEIVKKAPVSEWWRNIN